MNSIPHTTRQQVALRKARQRERMRAWLLKQTSGKITTAEGYVMYLMRQTRTATPQREKAKTK